MLTAVGNSVPTKVTVFDTPPSLNVTLSLSKYRSGLAPFNQFVVERFHWALTRPAVHTRLAPVLTTFRFTCPSVFVSSSHIPRVVLPRIVASKLFTNGDAPAYVKSV